MAATRISAEEFDRKFEAGEDISKYIDWRKAKRPGREQMARIIREFQKTKRRLIDEAKRIDEILAELQGATKGR